MFHVLFPVVSYILRKVNSQTQPMQVRIGQRLYSDSVRTYDIHNYYSQCTYLSKDNFWYRNIGMAQAPSTGKDENYGSQAEIEYDTTSCTLTIPRAFVYYPTAGPNARASVIYDLYLIIM